ncbi:MAG: riboflavin synthase [Bacteroidota bacterium]
MFTGLVEELGRVVNVRQKGRSIVFSIRGRKTAGSLGKNDSIAVDGVCLTVLKKQGKVFQVQAVEETLRKSTLGDVQKGDPVNLERPLAANGRLGGHFVLGHVDGTGIVRRIDRRKNSWLFHIGIGSRFRRFLIPVGSVTVNGVSLTVATLKPSGFVVSIIPHTWDMTTFRLLQVGEKVNIEYDVLGKYALNALRAGKRK